ncbi:RluA family pseudouridine synthase [Humidisolicoccus flavus]|uniref:RluA family pseudouridine synthase n=1 Tax=Humidisolicoccus flavus TaxID=3111414 RepID=UPI0032518E36
MEHRALPVPDGLDGQRADAGLSRMLGLSRTAVQDAIVAGGLLQDGTQLAKSDRLRSGAWLEFSWSPPREPVVEPVELPSMKIVHDDDDIIVIDKPIGVAAHPSLGWTGPTVLGALAGAGYQVSTMGPAERNGIVHRLDAGTSGLMVVAKSDRAYQSLKAAFHDREVTKIYHAAVQGHPDPLRGTIDAPIGRHPGHEWRFAVTANGKHAVTHYEAIEAFRSASLLEIELETGRTHQIRVHMSAQRHPCLGDTMYGADPVLAERLGLSRQWLHAMRLGFAHPATGAYVEFASEYPDDLNNALKILTEGTHVSGSP